MALLRSVLVRSLTFGLFAGLLSLSLAAHATGDFTGYLYVTDYGAQNLDRYSYKYHSATNTIDTVTPAGAGGSTTSAIFLTGQIKEGLQGTLSDIIVVNTGGSSLTRYNLNGGTIGTIAIKNADNTAHTLSGIGNVVITKDGKYLYAPEEAASLIDKIDLATGKIVSFTSFTGAHDLAIASDGTIYAAAYNKNDATSQGVYVLPSDLSSKTKLINFNDNGLTSPSGISVAKDGSLYIQQNVHDNTANSGAGPDGVYHYKLSGTGVTAAATFDGPTSVLSSSSLHFTFGNNIGPDGNIYIAALGGASGRTGNTGYTDGIYKYDPTSLVISNFIAGKIEGTSTAGASGLQAPKYIQFGYNFVPAYDAGYTPEPSGIVTGLGFLSMAGAGMLRARRRRRAPRSMPGVV